MAYPVSRAFKEALWARDREIDIRVKVLNKNGAIRLGHNSIVLSDGTVTMDWTNHMDEPHRVLDATFIDPDRLLDFSMTQGDSGNVWFSCKIQVEYGVKLPSGDFEYCPVFNGWVEELERVGEETHIMAGSKSVRHLSPYLLNHSWQVDKGTKFSTAIKDLFLSRGTWEKFLDIPVRTHHQKFKQNTHYALGMEAWKMGQFWAREMDEQLYFRGDGVLTLRRWPSDIVWEFIDGDDSVLTEWPSLRLNTTNMFNEAWVITDKVVDDGPHKSSRPEPVVGYAEVGQSDSLSKYVLSNQGLKPLVRIFERPNIQTFKGANRIARMKLEAGASGIEANVGLAVVPLPHLEEMDRVKLNFGTYGLGKHNFRVQRFVLPLTGDEAMQINWMGKRVPLHRNNRIRVKRR